jgi:hypothetical protein
MKTKVAGIKWSKVGLSGALVVAIVLTCRIAWASCYSVTLTDCPTPYDSSHPQCTIVAADPTDPSHYETLGSDGQATGRYSNLYRDDCACLYVGTCSPLKYSEKYHGFCNNKLYAFCPE